VNVNLSDLTWTSVELTAESTVVVLPLGSTEQHGPHLPLSTDTDIALALASRLAAARTDVVVAPSLPYGASGEHAGFPGTLSIGQAALELVIVELVRSADDFRAVVVVSGHGGNAEPLARAVAALRSERRRVLAWTPRSYADAHAGRTETSMLLALAPKRVQLDAAEAGNIRPLPELMAALRSEGVRSVSPNGVLGDPAGASAEEGRTLLDEMAAQLIEEVHDFLG
jgi:creatinine amidohydrolase